MDCELIEDTPKTANKSKPYDFQIDCKRFKDIFNFEFKETVESITLSLKENIENCEKSSRHIELEYK